MSQFNEVLHPIICDPYAEPTRHWLIERGRPAETVPERREAFYYYRPPSRSTGRANAEDVGTREALRLVNDLRDRVRAWRTATPAYAGVSGVTADLLAYWNRAERERERRLFFCQREAVETIIFLVEARADLRQGIVVPYDEPGDFIRYACKMATGAGKTTVMAMLAAWSILNKVADRTNRTFSDVVLVLCPNVTIRDRLEELKPERGEASTYRIRDLVPAHLMSELRKGQVIVQNWHNLAPQELNQVGGVGARVVQRGVESKTALVTRVLKDAGGKGNVLVLNDEAHHSYRIRSADDDDPDEDELAESDRREATIWIEGLDRIQEVRGINLCVDLSATPFYLTRSGNDPGRPFPWIVSDFGLIDAIESGLVKIPQLPVQDTTGRTIPAYFNVWKWIVEDKLTAGEKGGRRGQVKPEAVLRWAQDPIAQLAGLWRERFVEWREEAVEGRRPPVPPVFIIVCRDTRLAKVVYEWITGQSETPAPIDEFRNAPGREHTVRVDSRVVEDMASGVVRNDESRRLRFVLATIGKTQWPGGRPPDDYLDLVERFNRKAMEDGAPPIDGATPPGRDVRCIVSVAMLTEGWDATTVTHIVGLRPFESQLLCEQVIGRGLRRSQYHDLTVEEVAKVYGVPFELIPLKATPGTPTPPPKVHRVYAVSPDRDEFEIRFPRVEGYGHRVTAAIRIAWGRVLPLVLDPLEIPDETLLKALTSDRGGALSVSGPGEASQVSLEAWRRTRRLQETEFDLARAVTLRYAVRNGDGGAELPMHALFPQMLRAVRRLLREKVEARGRRDPRDVILEPYLSRAIEALLSAVIPAEADEQEVPRYEAHRGPGSTRDVDFWTSKAVRECRHSHLNNLVMDTNQWEQSAAFYLDTDEHVAAFVKNFNLGFAIPYIFEGEPREYVPDFLVRVRGDGREVGTLILETKGYDRAAEAKIAAAQRWVAAVSAEGSHGRWVYRCVRHPADVPRALASAADDLALPPRVPWRQTLRRFVEQLSASHGDRLHRVVLYGSRARGDADLGSDVDVLVVLKEIDNVGMERQRISALASDVSFDSEAIISALPVTLADYEQRNSPLLMNARREGVAIA